MYLRAGSVDSPVIVIKINKYASVPKLTAPRFRPSPVFGQFRSPAVLLIDPPRRISWLPYLHYLNVIVNSYNAHSLQTAAPVNIYVNEVS